MGESATVGVLGRDHPRLQLDIVESPGAAHAVVWPGVGAEKRSMHLITLPAGGRTQTMSHPSEAVYYLIRGGGGVAGPGSAPQEVSPGAMVHIEAETRYRFEATDAGMELIGGPCPADPDLYERRR
jgi:quercetin dioxygenase-like cupin family protein